MNLQVWNLKMKKKKAFEFKTKFEVWILFNTLQDELFELTDKQYDSLWESFTVRNLELR